ncbi:MAG: hypothetical protein AB7P04_09545 [Bacteriovoracia bacterium]
MSGLVNPEDFKTMEFKISVDNSVNRDPSRKQAVFDAQHAAELVEVNEQRLVLDAPARMCALGHNVMLGIRTDKIQFLSTAKVVAMESQGERDRLGILLMQYDKDTWLRLRALFVRRQEEIAGFLKDAKGI